MTTKYVEIIGKKEFAFAVLDLEHKIYIVHVESDSFDTLSSFFPLELDVHTSCRP